MHAHRTALRTGDLEFGANNATGYLVLLFYSGKQLSFVEKEARSMIMLMHSLGQTSGNVMMVPLWKMTCDFMGASLSPLHLTSGITDEESAFENATQQGNTGALWMFYLYRATFTCHCGEHLACLENLDKAKKVKFGGFNLLPKFYEGVSSLALARTSEEVSRRWRYFLRGRKIAKQIKQWAILGPANCRNKQLFLEAEMAAYMGNTASALSLFHQSIDFAKNEGFVGEVGLAYERLAIFNLQMGANKEAVAEFFKSCDAYNQWGSDTCSKRIDERINRLRDEPSE